MNRRLSDFVIEQKAEAVIEMLDSGDPLLAEAAMEMVDSELHELEIETVAHELSALDDEWRTA